MRTHLPSIFHLVFHKNLVKIRSYIGYDVCVNLTKLADMPSGTANLRSTVLERDFTLQTFHAFKNSDVAKSGF